MSHDYEFFNVRILFTPLINPDTYGSTVDVTQDIDVSDFIKSLTTIRREIDNGDNDFGIFTFGNINLTAINFTGKFNDENENGRSIFPFLRDRTKVEIQFRDKEGNATTRFRGLLNDDATRQNLEGDTVTFRILSLDSIFRQVRVAPGSIVTGDLFSTAIKKILNVPAITTTLTYSAANITVDLDLAIDNGEIFSNTVVKDRLDQLLLASNSILFVDSNDTVFVKPRVESTTLFLLNGRGDKYGRNQILSVKKFNSGLQRTFNSIKVNDNTVSTDTLRADADGFRQKSVSFDFITDSGKETSIADQLLAEFKVPKLELEVDVRTEFINDIELLDIVGVNYPYSLFPANGDNRLPTYGVAQYGTALYPIESGSFRITPDIKWKVIAIDEKPDKFTTVLKLRQAGKTVTEGYFNTILFGEEVITFGGEAITFGDTGT